MKIILKQDVPGLGYKDEIHTVKDGYGRNYLLPQRFAVLATDKAVKALNEELKQRAHKIAKIKADAEEAKEKKKPGIMSKVWKAVLTAVTSTFAALLGTWVSDKVSGKKTKSRKSAKERVVKNATSAATRTITKELTRDILGNLK